MHDRVDIMVDLETLGTGINAGIIQLGAVAIYDDGTTEECDLYCKPNGDIEIETLQWWLETNPELLKSIITKGTRYNNEISLLIDFCTWVNDLPAEEKYLWSNGSDFDIAIIRHKLQSHCSLELGVPFYHDRDLRTILEIAAKLSKMDEKEYKKHLRDVIGNNPRPHDALGDAQFQAKELVIMMSEINDYNHIPTIASDYQTKAARTIKSTMSPDDIEKHAIFGMCGEIGELQSIYQKAYQGHKIDEEHEIKELGDLLWFIAEYCTAKGWNLSEVMDLNIAKLEARYPNGFEEDKSLHRKEGDI